MTIDELFKFSMFMYGVTHGWVHQHLPLKDFMHTYPDIQYRPPKVLISKSTLYPSSWGCSDFCVSILHNTTFLRGNILSPYTKLIYKQTKFTLESNGYCVIFDHDDEKLFDGPEYGADSKFLSWANRCGIRVRDVTELDLMIYGFEKNANRKTTQ